MSVLVCPSPEDLSAFRGGTLLFDRHLAVSKHLKGCPACRAALAALPPAEDVAADDLTHPGLPAPSAETALEHEVFVRTVGPYRLGRLIGRGGMGVVYEAVHEKLRRRVAVKLLPRPTTADPDAAARFRREWAAVGRLDHPNVVRAFHADDSGGIPFLAMELIEGTDLGKAVQRTGPLAPADAAAAVRFAALGLAHAHSQGVIHRDVKPSNIVLTAAGGVKILDLGLAQLTDAVGCSNSRLTGPSYLGTADYMAPEQWEDASTADARTDVYALGCVLYYLLTGRAPFAAPEFRTALHKMQAHKSASPPDPRAADPAVPAGLVRAMLWMMRKDPIDRPRSAALVADALEPFAAAARLDRLAVAAGVDAPAPFADGPRTNPAAVPPTGHPLDEAAEAALMGATAVAAPPRRRRRWVVGVAVVLLPLLTGVAVLTSRGPTAGPDGPTVAPPRPAEATTPVSVATPHPRETAPAPRPPRPMTAIAATSWAGRTATAAAFAADGRGVYLGSSDSRLYRWDLGTGAIEQVSPGGGGDPVTAVAVLPDGDVLAAVGSRVWRLDPERKQPRRTFDAAAPVVSLAVAPDGRAFLAGHHTPAAGGPAATAWDPDSDGRLWQWPGVGGRAVRVAWGGKGPLAADDAGDLLRPLAKDPAQSARFPWAMTQGFRWAGLAGVGMSDDGRPVRVADAVHPESGPMVLMRVRQPGGTGVVSESGVTVPGGVAAAAVAGDRVAVAARDGSLWVGALASRNWVHVPAHAGGIGLVAVSADGRQVLTVGTEPEAKVWAVPDVR